MSQRIFPIWSLKKLNFIGYIKTKNFPTTVLLEDTFIKVKSHAYLSSAP